MTDLKSALLLAALAGATLQPPTAPPPPAEPATLAVPPGTVTPLTATARLYYQTASNYYIEFLRDEAVNEGFPDENAMCSGGPNRPFTVGPQSRTRGEYMYELWNNAPDYTTQPGYGKSPPELMQTSAASTSTR